MNKISLFIISVCFSYNIVLGQVTLTLQPGPTQGKDALLHELYSEANLPHGNNSQLAACDWTFDGEEATIRSIIEFDLNSIPANAVVISAILSLYAWNSDEGLGPHSTLSGTNAAWLERITTPWDESNVTWNTAPSSTEYHRVNLPASSGPGTDYENIDVTNLVQDMVLNPTSSYGFMFKLQEEACYRNLNFCSSDYSDSLRRPKLVIVYTVSPSITLTLQPGPADGKDALLHGLSTEADLPHGDNPQFAACDWTFDGEEGAIRSIIEFDLNSIPANATITTAKLSLYAWDSSDGLGSHSTLSGSNAAWIERVTSPWSENTVTWNTAPTSTSSHRVELQASSNPDENYENINVTEMVQDMISDTSAGHGFLLKLQDESCYRNLNFCSSDCSDSSRRPKLVIAYTVSPSITLTLQPGPADGKDALLHGLSTEADLPHGDNPQFAACDWTFDGEEGTIRSIIEFDLNSIPANATITTAKLSLYAWDSSDGLGSHSTLSGSNAAWIERVTSPWDEATVTWNTAPSTTEAHRIALSASNSTSENYENIDVTNLIKDMLLNPTSSYGFMFKLQNESYYRNLNFCSSDHSDNSRRPKLVITYIIKDTIAPVPDTINLENVYAECSVEELSAPTATDNVAGKVIGTTDTKFPITSQGTSVVTWLFDDGNGNVTTQQQNVIINDVTSPSINCKENMVINLNEGQTYFASQGNQLDYFDAYDNCSIWNIKNSINGLSTLENAEFIPGTYSILWTATDNGGNTSECSFDLTVNSYVGINSISEDILIYPNPTKNSLHIDIGNNQVEQIEICNVTGQVIKKISKDRINQYINLSNYANGVYLIKIKINNKIIIKKLIKD